MPSTWAPLPRSQESQAAYLTSVLKSYQSILKKLLWLQAAVLGWPYLPQPRPSHLSHAPLAQPRPSTWLGVRFFFFCFPGPEPDTIFLHCALTFFSLSPQFSWKLMTASLFVPYKLDLSFPKIVWNINGRLINTYLWRTNTDRGRRGRGHIRLHKAASFNTT